jgi:hypothetical protein
VAVQNRTPLADPFYLRPDRSFPADTADTALHMSESHENDQMGADYSRVADFARKARKHLQKISMIWSDLQYEAPRGRLKLYPSPPSVPADVEN